MNKPNIEALGANSDRLAEARKDANRKVNLTYLIAGAYVQALEMTNVALDWSSLELIQSNKQLTKEIYQTTKRLMYLIEKLQENSVLCMDDDDTLVHEDTLHMFFALFMSIVDRAGIDQFSDLRLFNMYNIINKYKPLVNWGFTNTREDIAFNYIRKRISEDPTMSMDSQGNIIVTIEENGKLKKHQVMQPR